MTLQTDPCFDDSMARTLEIGGRLTGEPSARLINTAFRHELDDQLCLFDAISLVDLVHSLTMIENGILPTREGAELLRALQCLQSRPDDFNPDPALGDLYTNREAWLRKQTAAAEWLGCGRARREAVTTAYLIKLRELLLDFADSLIEFAHVLLNRAEQYRSALMPDYTYLQASQCTSFGHYLLGFAYPALRDLERVQAAFVRVNLSPAGCGSSNGSRIPQARERQAALLGFAGVAPHARDAMWQADLPIELMAVATASLVGLDRLAEDLQIFSTEEFGLLELHDSHARASKILPQKKNPFALTYIRGEANQLIGLLAGSAALGRTPSGQPDNRTLLYGMLPETLTRCCATTGLFAEVINLLAFNAVRARARLNRGFTFASDLAEVLVLECGLPFRDAHRLVGHWVRQHIDDGSFQNLTVESLVGYAQSVLGRSISLEATVLNDALNPESAIAARTEAGCAAESSIGESLAQCRSVLGAVADWVQKQRLTIKTADVRLNEALDTFLTGSNED